MGFPDGLISTKYHSKKGRFWYLLKLSVRSVPNWAVGRRFQLSIFREIIYVNQANEPIGIGRSYMPISLIGLRIVLKCVSLKNPQPLGVVLLTEYGNDIDFKVTATESIKDVTPFSNAPLKVKEYKRILTLKEPDLEIAVEEEFFGQG